MATAPTRKDINVVVPYENGDDANAKNRKAPDRNSRAGIWANGGGGGTFEAVIVLVDDEDPPSREAERALINRSLETALGPHPPFAFVRLDWPEQLYNLPNHVINDDDFRQVRAHYGATPTHHDSPKDEAWWSHLEDTHNFLIRLQDCQPPGGFEAMAILRAQSENMGGLFYVPERPLYIRPGKRVQLGERAASLHGDGQYTSFVLCEESLPALLNGWYARRFLITMVEVGEDTGHWATVIFDRYTNEATDKMPHLYILDPDVSGRGARADHIIQVWRQVLREVGYPAHFMAYILPLTNRPADWTTPYIALFSGIQAMRGLSGDRITCMTWIPKIRKHCRYFMEPAPEDHLLSPAQINRPNGGFVYGGNSDLRFRDWCIRITPPRMVADVDESLDWVLHHLVGCAAMELGIRRDTSFAKTPLRGIRFNLGRLADDIEKWSTLRVYENFTMLGGFIPFCPAFAIGRRLSAGGEHGYVPTAHYDVRGGGLNPLRHRQVLGPAPSTEDCKPERKYFASRGPDKGRE